MVSNTEKWSLEGKSKKQIARKIKQLSDNRDYWKDRYRSLEASSSSQRSTLKAEHDDKLVQVLSSHSELASKGKARHDNKIDNMKQQYAVAISAVKSEHADEYHLLKSNVASLQSDLSIKENQLVRLERKFKYEKGEM